jgi:glycogen synthase
LAVGDDERVRLLGEVDRGRLGGLIGGCDVVVVPSLWECWPYAVLEALHLNRPVLGTPVGGLVEMVREGCSGWLAAGPGAVALADAVEGLLAARGRVGELVRSGSPVGWARGLSDEREILDGYEALARVPLGRAVARRGPVGGQSLPLVSAVVPYFRAARFVRETIASLLAQSYERLEIVVVNDGSFEDEDWVLGEVAGRLPVVVISQMNQGLGAARNFGVSQSRGRYVFPLDADNVVEPEFVARGVQVLESCPQVAYVTSWSRYIEEDGTPRSGPDVGYEPLGNQAALVGEENVAGDAAAVIRRRLFDAGFRYSEELTSYEDWAFYRRLHEAGHYGVVIPQRLLGYRVREDSMQAQIAQPNRARLLGEIQAHIQENATQWTAPSA